MTGAYGVAALPLTREEAGMAAGAQQTLAAESSGHFGLRTLPSLTKAAVASRLPGECGAGVASALT
jgi:hypothetical protein